MEDGDRKQTLGTFEALTIAALIVFGAALALTRQRPRRATVETTVSQAQEKSSSCTEAVKVYLEEYKVLREELLEIIKFRNNLVLITWGITGGIFSFAGDLPYSYRSLAFYLVPLASFTLGAYWIANQMRQARIDNYFIEHIRKRLRQLTRDDMLLAWDTAPQREINSVAIALSDFVARFATFVLTGTVAVWLATFAEGPVRYPELHWGSVVLLAIIGIALVWHFLGRTKEETEKRQRR